MTCADFKGDYDHRGFDNGRYIAPQRPGSSARMLPESIAAYRYPDGRVWQTGHASS